MRPFSSLARTGQPSRIMQSTVHAALCDVFTRYSNTLAFDTAETALLAAPAYIRSNLVNGGDAR